MPTLHISEYTLYHFDISIKETMQEYIDKLSLDLSDYTFAANYIWLSSASGFYAIINDTFCLFVMQGGKLSMLLPPIGSIQNISKAIEICFGIMNVNNSTKLDSKIEYVHKDILHLVCADDVAYQGIDYVYECRDLVELKGNNYHTKRNEINKFCKQCSNVVIEEIVIKKHKEQILKLHSKWISARGKNLPLDDDRYLEGIYFEQKAIKRLLENYEELSLVGVVLFNDEKLIGFSVAERLNGSTASVIIEKCDAEVVGSSAYIFREFCKILEKKYGVFYINAGDDMGFENLKRAKMSYHPKMLLPKYTIYQNS